MMISRLTFILSIFLFVGCAQDLDDQNNISNSLFRSRALAIEFDNFIASEKVLEICSKGRNCVIEISFFNKEDKHLILLTANQYKSAAPPGQLSTDVGFAFSDSKYIIIRNKDFLKIDEFIRIDFLDPQIPEKLNMGYDELTPLLYTYKIFRIENQVLIEHEMEKR